MPTLFQGDAANAARGFEDEIMVRCPAHQMALAFRSAMELIEPRPEFNRITAFTALTIGQAPRPDVVPIIDRHMPKWGAPHPPRRARRAQPR
jgi:hypothetical protein